MTSSPAEYLGGREQDVVLLGEQHERDRRAGIRLALPRDSDVDFANNRLVFGGGLLTTLRTSGRVRQALADELTRPIVGFDHKFAALPSQRVDRIAEVLDACDGPVDLATHSFGAIDATGAILGQLDAKGVTNVRSLTIVNPAGVIPGQLLHEILLRGAYELANPGRIHTLRRLGFIATASSCLEGSAQLHLAYKIGQSNVVPALQCIQDQGVFVQVYAGLNDRIIPAGKLQDALADSGIPLIMGPGDHEGIVEDPAVMRSVAECITAGIDQHNLRLAG